MQQNALNLIAIGVFLMTMTSLLGGIFGLSPFVPAGITAAILALASVDTLSWQGKGMTLFLALFDSTEQRQRIVHHEAGHFLAGYHLGIPITGYSLTPWEALQQGQGGEGGVSFDLDALDLPLRHPQEHQLLRERLSTSLMAGIAAEKMLYGQALGGRNDREQLQQLLVSSGIPASRHLQQEKWALLQAKNLLERHQAQYQALVTAMTTRATLADCIGILQKTEARTIEDNQQIKKKYEA